MHQANSLNPSQEITPYLTPIPAFLGCWIHLNVKDPIVGIIAWWSQFSNIVGPLLLVVKTRVDFQPIILGAGPGPYSSSGASGAIYLATNHDPRRKRAKA